MGKTMMNRYSWITFIALAVFVIAWPVYALREPARMQAAELAQRQLALEDGIDIYLKSCAQCHGASGEGIGVMPALNNPGLADADESVLFKTIARAGHGTTMAAWHVDEGGILSDYQIGELVDLIRFVNWNKVQEIAQAKGFEAPAPPAAEIGVAYLEGEGKDDPHSCIACHEDPAAHIGQFGLNCARCHSTIAWAPAQLTKHYFALEHGDQGQVACETCHVNNYYEHTCYGCHDHQPDQMEQVHNQEAIVEYDACVDCHPTGRPGEAKQMMMITGRRQ
jgi:mono/diheme cytochrome c family protein